MDRVQRTTSMSWVILAVAPLAIGATAWTARADARVDSAEFSAASQSPTRGQKPPEKPKTPEKKGKPGPVVPPKPAAIAPRMAPWIGEYDAAKKTAKARNVPILIMAVLEGEQSNDDFRERVLTDAELTKKSAECIVVIANNGSHPKKTIDVEVDGARTQREVCASYPMFDNCVQHQHLWADLFREFHEEGGQLRCPQTIVLTPDGAISLRINNGNVPQVTEVIAGIAGVQASCGPGLSELQLKDVLRTLDEGRNHAKEGAWADAWRTWQKVIALTPKTAYGAEAAREAPKALENLQKEFDRIAALLVPGTAVQAFKDLTAFAKQVAGTPLEKTAALRLKAAESDKAIRVELQTWRLAVEADQLLAEARDAFEQKQDKKGEASVKKLLAKRFAATAAQATARQLWPEIAKIEDAKTPPK